MQQCSVLMRVSCCALVAPPTRTRAQRRRREARLCLVLGRRARIPRQSLKARQRFDRVLALQSWGDVADRARAELKALDRKQPRLGWHGGRPARMLQGPRNLQVRADFASAGTGSSLPTHACALRPETPSANIAARRRAPRKNHGEEP